tara:strand:- start:870 stop:2942 length:2073 start_codon:yes stop_codon:yes gene_type:complete
MFTFVLSASQIAMPSIDTNILFEEDSNRQPGNPERYAYGFDVDINLFEQGHVEQLDNGDKVWRLRIGSDNAIGMKLYFNQFYLPQGSTLAIYTDYMVDELYDSSINHEDQEFSHRLLQGDVITIEYFEPANTIENALLNISTVYHAYKDILGFYPSDQERNCGVNVACDNGEFEDQINSVIFLDMNGYICSAALINNTSFDLTPYVLTAYHCVDPETPGEHNWFSFYFKHQSSSCSGSNGSYSYSRTGSTLRSSYYYSDFALLEMDYTPAASFNGYYAGWNRSSSPPQLSAGIHHPGGDPKKINYDNDNAFSDGWYTSNTHWRLNWDEGGTEGGSSGSPLFDDEKLIVGQLHGGSGECGSGTDYYGKMNTSWTGGGTSSTRLSDWLDPSGTGYVSVTGTYNGEGGGEDPPEITLLSPNGGETLDSGSYEITWNDNFDDNISIKLYKSGVFVSTIVSSTESDGSYFWNISPSLEDGDDYKIKITNIAQSTLYDQSNSNFSIYSPGIVSLSIESVDIYSEGGTINVYMTNETAVAGFQFVVSDSPNYINITGVNDLADSGFTLSSSEEGQILAFSLLGNTIDPGSGPLVSIDFETINTNDIELCLESAVFSNPSASPIPVVVGDCLSVELTQILSGDLNQDQVIDVLDAVLLVNGVLNPNSLNDSQILAGDINTDNVLNVLDIVLLIGVILN